MARNAPSASLRLAINTAHSTPIKVHRSTPPATKQWLHAGIFGVHRFSPSGPSRGCLGLLFENFRMSKNEGFSIWGLFLSFFQGLGSGLSIWPLLTRRYTLACDILLFRVGRVEPDRWRHEIGISRQRGMKWFIGVERNTLCQRNVSFAIEFIW